MANDDDKLSEEERKFYFELIHHFVVKLAPVADGLRCRQVPLHRRYAHDLLFALRRDKRVDADYGPWDPDGDKDSDLRWLIRSWREQKAAYVAIDAAAASPEHDWADPPACRIAAEPTKKPKRKK